MAKAIGAELCVIIYQLKHNYFKMKKQNFPIGLMMIAAGMLLYSCSNNDTAQPGANNIIETTTNAAAADSLSKIKELAQGKDSTRAKEKEESEEN